MTSRPIRLVYLCLDGASSVIESQVVDHLRNLHEVNGDVRIDLFLIGRRSEVRARGGALFRPEGRAEIEGMIGGRLVTHQFLTPLTGLLSALWLLWRRTFPFCYSRRCLILGRSKDGAFVGALFKCLCLGRPRLIYDQRGDVVAEYLYSHSCEFATELRLGGKLALGVIRFMEWFGYKICDRTMFVTDTLRRVIERRYRCAASKPSIVFPCLADAERFRWSADDRQAVRRELGFGDDQIVLTYGGSLAAYQCLDEMLALYGAMRRRNVRVAFLFLTNRENHEEIRRRLSAIAPKDAWRVVEAPHGDIAKYFCAGDLGLLLRRRSPVNASAAPTKFAEYVLCGLPVVMTEGIGDYSALVRENNWGVVCEDLSDAEKMAEACLAWLSTNRDDERRSGIAAQARESLSRHSRLNEYAKFVSYKESSIEDGSNP